MKIGIHAITAYPPSCLNRDDFGRPKTAYVGGVERLRISSQAHKRAYRVSEVMREGLSEMFSTRSKHKGLFIRDRLLEGGLSEEMANQAAFMIIRSMEKTFSKSQAEYKDLVKKAKEKKCALRVPLEMSTLAFIGPREEEAISQLVDTLIEEKRLPKEEEIGKGKLLSTLPGGLDIAMFGRMFAKYPEYNVEAAVSVAHAFSVNPARIQSDYFTAVDDLSEGAGSGHLGTTEFGEGTFYLYLIVDKDLLVSNCGGDVELANKGLSNLLKAIMMVSPSGKKSSFASVSVADYVFVEKGSVTFHMGAKAFANPIEKNFIERAINSFERVQKAYYTKFDHINNEAMTFNVTDPQGPTLETLLDFVTK